jgi:hypothetical protein
MAVLVTTPGQAELSVTSENGDTWATLAGKHLGSQAAATELALFNGTTPEKPIRAGTEIKLPGPVRDEALKMINRGEDEVAAAMGAGVPAAQTDPLKKKLVDARSAYQKARYNQARALARQVVGDAGEARVAHRPKRIQLSISVSEEKGTAITVDKGTVEVSAGGVRTTATSGEAVAVSRGDAPRKTTALPAPGLSKPRNAEVVYGEEVRLSWQAVTGASVYTVDVATDPEFKHRLMIAKTSERVLVLPGNLRNGTYWWRVAAVGASGSAGLRSDVRRFDYAQGESKPTVRVGDPQWGGN